VKYFIITFLFAFSALANFQKTMETDIAVDLKTGETLILQKHDNPKGKIYVYDRAGVLKGLVAFESSEPINWQEIELTRPDQMLVLQQYSDSWTLKKLRKSNHLWDLKNPIQEIRGDGLAYNMKGLTDEYITVDQVTAEGMAQTVVLDILTLKQKDIISAKTLSNNLQLISRKNVFENSSGHGLGFTAGLASGLGFAYRKHFENRFGIQLGGIAWGDKNSSFTSLGIELIRTLSRTEKMRFYAVAASSVFINNRLNYDYSPCYPANPVREPIPVQPICDPSETHNRTGTLNFGAGIGIEFNPSQHVGISFELPLTVMLDLEKQNRYKRKGVYPVPSVSLVYYF